MSQAMLAMPEAGAGVTIRLRDYQEDALAAIDDAYGRGVRRQLISLPTGAGKTFVAAHLVSRRKQRTVFMVHRDELARQTVRQMRMVNPALSIGVCKADQNELGADIIVASAQTLASAKRLDALIHALRGAPVLFISDECHHDLAPSRKRAISLLYPDLLVGLTATPMRGDKLGLDAIYEEIVFHLPMRRLVEANQLARPVGLRIETEVELDAVRTVAGEFNEHDLEETVDTAARNSLVVESWRTHASDRKRTIAFCVTVAHAARLRDAFREAGVAAEMVDGTTPVAERQRIFAAFKDGDIQVLTNCMVLTEGFDEPGIDCCLMCRPTKSTGLYIQCVGRALRWAPAKPDALIIDFVDATTRHQLVTLPSLAGAEPRKEGEKPVTISEANRKAGQVMDLFDALAHEGRLREREAIVLDLLASSPFAWQPLPEGVFMAAAGDRFAAVIPRGDGFVPVVIARGGAAHQVLLDRPVDAETAMSIAHGQIPATRLTEKDAFWRSRPASEKQLAALVKWRVAASPGITRGQASELLDMAAFRAALRKSGLDRRRTG